MCEVQCQRRGERGVNEEGLSGGGKNGSVIDPFTEGHPSVNDKQSYTERTNVIKSLGNIVLCSLCCVQKVILLGRVPLN